MQELSQIIALFDAVLLPLIGGVTLFLSKVSSGETARWAERQFLAALLVITLVTLRTVVHCEDTWLIHTITLSVMIVGALKIPDHDSSLAA